MTSSPNLKPVTTILKFYNGNSSVSLGIANIKCIYKGKKYTIKFLIVNHGNKL